MILVSVVCRPAGHKKSFCTFVMNYLLIWTTLTKPIKC
jgi:hypothetical protein